MRYLSTIISQAGPNEVQRHWHSSHYAVTRVRNKNSNIQRRSPNVVKAIFHATRDCS